MEPYVHTVQYYETDRMGITHHANYIRWMEEARVDLLVQIGWPLERLESMGLFIPVVSLDCKYKSPTTFADRVKITVELVKWGGVRMTLAYEMRKEDGTLVCSATSDHCFLDPAGRIVRLQRDYPEVFRSITGLLPEGKDETK